MHDLSNPKPYTLDRTVRLLIGVVVVCAAIFLVKYLSGVLIPFLVAWLAAYLIYPLVKYTKKLLRIKSNALAVILTLVVLTAVIVTACWFLFPYILGEIGDMAAMFGRYTKEYVNNPQVSESIHEFVIEYIDMEKIQNLFTRDEIMNMVRNSIDGVWNIMGSGFNVIFMFAGWLIILLYLVFILIDYERVTDGFKNMIPPKYKEDVLMVLEDVESVMNHYFRGQSIVSFFVGIMFCIGFLIIGLPMAIVFGLFIGVLNMVPYLQLVSIPIAAVLSLVLAVDTDTNFWIIFAEVIGVYCINQLIQDMVLIPRILGKYMGLNPAILFLALSIWGTLLGLIGFIVAIPLTTLLISYYKRYIINKGIIVPDDDSIIPSERKD